MVGRVRGRGAAAGFGPKLLGGFGGLSQPRELVLTPGRTSGVWPAGALPAGHTPGVVVADRGYDKEVRGEEAVIPTPSHRVVAPHADRKRNMCERSRARAKQ